MLVDTVGCSMRPAHSTRVWQVLYLATRRCSVKLFIPLVKSKEVIGQETISLMGVLLSVQHVDSAMAVRINDLGNIFVVMQ